MDAVVVDACREKKECDPLDLRLDLRGAPGVGRIVEVASAAAADARAMDTGELLCAPSGVWRASAASRGRDFDDAATPGAPGDEAQMSGSRTLLRPARIYATRHRPRDTRSVLGMALYAPIPMSSPAPRLRHIQDVRP